MWTCPSRTYYSVTTETEVVSVTLRIKTSTARIMPASTATVRSANTVNRKVASHTAISILDSFKSSGISFHSPMLYETTKRIAARIDNGTNLAKGTAKTTMARRVKT